MEDEALKQAAEIRPTAWLAGLGLVSGLTLLSLGTAAVATAQTFTITDLGATDATVKLGFSFRSGQISPAVTAINNVGQVVGTVVNANGDEHAALWQKDSQGNYSVTDLGTLGGAGTSSRAFGINAAGQVVGESSTDNGVDHPVLWQKDPQGNYSITDLATLGGGQGTARAINDAGQVAGFAFNANGEQHAVLWQKDSQGNYSITDLRTLGGAAAFSRAYGINAVAQVVGLTSTPPFGQAHAFLWQNGQMTDLGTILGPCGVGSGDCGFGQAFAINAGGQVVGYSTAIHAVSSLNSATLWQNGGKTDLGALLGGVTFSVALGTNAAGQVVGTSNTLGPGGEVDGIQHALLWQNDSQGANSVTDLDTHLPPGSDWKRLISASAINDQGQIVGLGEFSDGLIHRYLLGPSVELLDPVPELLAGPAVTIEKERLASKGRRVFGAAADGVAQLVLRIPATSDVTLTVLDGQGQPSLSLDETGSLGTIGGSPDRSNIVAPVASTSAGSFAFALYRAPTDFARANNTGDLTAESRTVQIRIERAGQATFQIPIKIVRPPVVLIHGLWSKPSVWNDFRLASDSRFQPVFRANYEGTNGESIEHNTSVVNNQLRILLPKLKSIFKVAAVQFDLVTHSMGGLIARNLATLGSYQRDSNYRHGDIHKLITLDTPHLGSQFANRLNASSSPCRTVFFAFGKKVGGAVKDLEYGSAAIAKLLERTAPIKARVIAGQATLRQEVESAAVFTVGTRVLGLGLCSSLLPPGGFAEVFSTPEDPGGHSDLIVSVVSQLGKTVADGRRDPPADAPYEGIEHTKAPPLFFGPSAADDPTIGQRVIDLLNTSVATPDFGDILP
ncbi:MAG: alpha/beta fold hydrolase [Candidatus Methylomirabilis sp.]